MRPVENNIHYAASTEGYQNCIVFLNDAAELVAKDISYVAGVPVLFSSLAERVWSLDEQGNLIFHHDLLKSAFYLLSGYHEYAVNTSRDHWGRVPFKHSLQNQLGITDTPVVNEYFSWIAEGFEAFLKHHNQPPIQKRQLFSTFGFLLSHDIDLIDKYGWNHLGYKVKELVGMVPSEHSKFTLAKATLQSFLEFINPFRSNPYWNFDSLMQWESSHNMHASYYFLDNDADGGSSYRFEEERVKSLFQKLQDCGHEIGIHGTTKTINDSHALASQIRNLSSHCQSMIMGGRQHRLLMDLPETFRNHTENQLKYDSSYGYAEHEGFRNSFCLPFKPYDFEREEMIDLWEFPLMAMDVTLFSYRRLTPEQIIPLIEHLIDQVLKHHGIFTLLWHNSFFDETLYPGVTKTYQSILNLVTSKKGRSLTGRELTELLDET